MSEDRQKARRFEDLEVWQCAHKVVLAVYECTRSFPAEERFGLVPQMPGLPFRFPPTSLRAFAAARGGTRLTSTTWHKVRWRKPATT